MIYVLGSNLNVSDLPLSNTLQYTIQNDKTKIAGILGMGIRKPDVVKCYVNDDIVCNRIANGCESKIVRFKDDNALLALLSGSSSENTKITDEATKSEEAPDIVHETETTASDVTKMQDSLYDAADKEPIAPEDITKVEKDSRDEVEEASSAPMMAQPIDGGSLFEIDSLRQKLATTEAILAQNRKCLEETKQERNELYDYAAKQIEELTEEYEGRLKEAQLAVETLRAQIEAGSESPLSNFEVYAEKCRAVIKTGISLSNPPHNTITIAPGSPDAAKTLYQSLAILALSSFAGVIVDFTGDPAFSNTLVNLAYRLRGMEIRKNQNREPTPNDYINCNVDANKDLVRYIRDNEPLDNLANTNFGNSRVLIAGFYHDIALLTMNWEKFFEDVSSSSLAKGQPVIVLLPTINTFISRYLVSYLATGVRGCVATVCSSSDLYSTELNLRAVPDHRVKVLALNYTENETTRRMLSQVLNTRFSVRVFAANKFFYQDPTPELFMQDTQNNSRIWQEAFAQGT